MKAQNTTSGSLAISIILVIALVLSIGINFVQYVNPQTKYLYITTTVISTTTTLSQNTITTLSTILFTQYNTIITTSKITTTSLPLAPDFTLPIVGSNGLTGQTATLSSFRGKVILVEFMEPWCLDCQNMAPILNSLYAKYGSQNVVFISVSGAWNGATADDAAQFIQTYHSDWFYVYDSSGTVFNTYGVTATPTFFIINIDGYISTKFYGPQSFDVLSNALSNVQYRPVSYLKTLKEPISSNITLNPDDSIGYIQILPTSNYNVNIIMLIGYLIYILHPYLLIH